MKKLKNKLNKNQKLLRTKTVKITCKDIKNLFKSYHLKCQFKNELDYYNNLCIAQGIKNKKIYEKVYEDNRQDLLELWDSLDRNKKNFFANQALEKYLSKMPFFEYEHKICRLAMFEPLFNSLYENNIVVLELPQYFKLRNDFQKHVIDPFKTYFDLPYRYHYINVVYIYSNDEVLVLYEKLNTSLYFFYKNKTIEVLGLDEKLINKIDLALVKSYISNDLTTFVTLVNQSTLFNTKTKTIINKYYRKKSNEK